MAEINESQAAQIYRILVKHGVARPEFLKAFVHDQTAGPHPKEWDLKNPLGFGGTFQRGPGPAGVEEWIVTNPLDNINPRVFATIDAVNLELAQLQESILFIQFIGSSSSNNATDTSQPVVVTKPIGVQEYDFLLAIRTVEQTPSPLSAPAGWTQSGPSWPVYEDGAIDPTFLSVYWRFAEAAEPSNYTWPTAGGDSTQFVGISAYRNVSQDDPIYDPGDFTTRDAPNNDDTIPTVSVSLPGDPGKIVVVFFGAGDGITYPDLGIPTGGVTCPGGAIAIDGIVCTSQEYVGVGSEIPDMTERIDDIIEANRRSVSFSLHDEDSSLKGESGTRSITYPAPNSAKISRIITIQYGPPPG